MDLSIIIVNWNVREYLNRCVESIFKFTQNITFEVIVVDNASNDGSMTELRQLFRDKIQSGQLLLIENKQNAGFSRANNQGLKEAQGNHILFMNPDMEFVENTPRVMKNWLDHHPEAGIVTCKLLFGDKSLQPNIKHHPTWISQAFILLKLHHLFVPKFVKHYLAKEFDYESTGEVEQVMGAFVYISHQLINDLHGWDEDYWLSWEDVDLCRRVQKKGLKVFYLPDTNVIHYESKSFEKVPSVTKQRRFNRSLFIYFKKHHQPWEYYSLMAIAPISVLLAYVVQLFHAKPKPQSRF